MEAGTGRGHEKKQCDKKEWNTIKKWQKGGGLAAPERASNIIFWLSVQERANPYSTSTLPDPHAIGVCLKLL